MDPVRPSGETLGELLQVIRYFLTAFRKDVLEEIDIEGATTLRAVSVDQHINERHYFEAMDRVSVALDYCLEFVGNHPVVRKNTHLSTIFGKAEKALAELYQETADLAFDRSDI